MMTGLLRRFMVVTLVAALAGVFSLTPAWSNGDASWRGRVIDIDGVTPRTDVVVNLVTDLGDIAASSEPTRADGAFSIDRAPAGDYALLIETPDGAFLAGETMSLQPGRNTPATLHLQGGMSHRDQDYGFGSGQKGMKTWVKWTIAGAIAIVAVAAIY